MDKNTLYEILEVSENASEEIIEKAYKVLVKKYHPDLQPIETKQKAEDKMKKINEAYDVLGNEEKRKEYDKKLRQIRENEKERYKQTIQHEEKYKKTKTNQYNNTSTNQDKYNYEEERAKYEKKLKQEEKIQRENMQRNLNKEYENAYYNYLRNLGYKVKHHWTKENIIDFFIVIGIMAIIIIVLWFIPPTHDWMVSFYEGNPILKILVDIIIGIIIGIFKGIWNFIASLFR